MESPGEWESPLRSPGLAVLTGIVGTVALCWLYLVAASVDMYGRMDGLAAWMMHGTWDGRYFMLMFLMWTVMMAGMMLPSAVPTILRYGAVGRASLQSQHPVAAGYAFAGGYLLVWTGFSLVATLVHWRLAEAALLSPMMESASRPLAALLLITAGVYQWTPFKRACLGHCRSPMGHLSRHRHAGAAGAVRMGLAYGLSCLGCCWALMLLLFFGGVMNLLWIAGITSFVLLEKLVPFGTRVGRITGLPLVAAGVSLLVG